MRGCIIERSPGHFAVIVDMHDSAGKRKRKWHTVVGTREDAEMKRDRLIEAAEHDEVVDLINDADLAYSLGQDEDIGVFLVRFKGTEQPFGVFVARNFLELFWLVDIQTDPYQCECTALTGGDAFFFEKDGHQQMSEPLEERFSRKRAWRWVGEGVREYYEAKSKRQKLARLENEAANLGELFKDLKRKANDRFNGHR